MIIVTFRVIIDTGNVSIYIHIIWILQHLTLKINHRNGGGGGVVWTAHFWDNTKCPWLPRPIQKMTCLFLLLTTYLSHSIVSSTQSLAQIKSQEFIGQIKYFMTTSIVTCQQWHSRFCEMLYQKLGAPWPDATWQDVLWKTTTYKEGRKCFI